jgi:DNA-binding SARP family transcriptional activator/tetratricopeptide (TPR) repeat protein
MTGVRIRLATAITVDVAGRSLSGRELGSRKARTLLALLAAERGRLVPLDRVVDQLWGDDPPADPGANVSTLVSRTRRLLGDGVLAATGRAYGLLPGGAWSVDLDEAETLVDEAEGRLGEQQSALAAAASRRAVELLGTPPALPDEADADWVRAVRREAAALRRRARHVLAEATVMSDPDEAEHAASLALEDDPLDEQAVRDVMRAAVQGGRPAAALLAYDSLARRLRHDLGTDPSDATSQVHLAVLRESVLPEDRTARRTEPQRPTLIGREVELSTVEQCWERAGAGSGCLLLVEGEAGIGKTRLIEAARSLAEGTGGLVLSARCHPSERSLFLQPFVDALRSVLLDQPGAALAGLVGGHEPAWVSLLPELTTVLGVTPLENGPPELLRRHAYDAVAAILRRLARTQPVLLVIDDLHDGGAATVDLLGYLAGRLERSAVLVVAALRAEAEATVDRLRDRAQQLVLGPLPASAVDALASASGLGEHGAAVMARTAGHPLSVVECLRALRHGDSGVPSTLADALLSRVRALEPAAREVVEAAAVLRRRLEPRLLADLTETSELSAVRQCEELTRVRMLVRTERHYEFANDLVQECVHDSLSRPLAVAYHRRAADLLSERPETMAEHAYAAGDLERAAQGWLLAGAAAMRGSALEDARALFARGLEATQDPALRVRLLLARARTHEARTRYAEGLADITEALRLAEASGERRLQLAAHRALGGDVPVGLHLPMPEIARHLEQALVIAADLGDRRAEADVTTRLAVLESNRLLLGPALARAEATLHRAEAAGNDDARLLALDGLKTVLFYLGDAQRLTEVTDQLIPMLRSRTADWLLQWTVFESALGPASAGQWDEVRARVSEALEINRRTGYSLYGGYFLAFQGWFDRLAGDLDGALRSGRQALRDTSASDHPWWYAAAAGLLAATLVEAGHEPEAEDVARRGLAAAGAHVAEGWRLRCLAPLAAVSGDPSLRRQATQLLDSISCPPGRAWLTGADCYLLVARAAERAGDLDAQLGALSPLRNALPLDGWSPVRARVESALAQISSATS